MLKISRFIERYENMPLGIGLWLATALSLIFLRDGIECLVSTGSFAIPDGFHLLHVPIFFLSLLLCLIIILHFFTKTEIGKVSKIALTCFFVIVFPVLFDLFTVIFAKTTITYNYIGEKPWICLLRFFDFSYTIPALPRSIRFEIGLITLLSLLYIFLKRKKALPALAGAFIIFLVCFAYVSIPALLIESFKAFTFILNVFRVKNFPLHKGQIDEVVIALLELILSVALALIWLWRHDPAKCKTIIGNMRLTRSLHYMILCLAGALLQCLHTPLTDLFSLIRIAGSLLAIGFAFQFCVVINDIFDVTCDRISNAARPLVTQALDPGSYLRISFVYLAFSLMFAYWVGNMCFMIVLLFIVLYFIYSAPPLRLKRFFPLPCMIIGIEAVLAFAAGECSLERTGLAPIPFPPFHWFLLIAFSLSSNIKDFKDVLGDKQAGIPTLPTIFGEKISRLIVGFFVAFSYCLAPFYLHLIFPKSRVLVQTLAFAAINFIYIQRRDSKEGVVFFLYFIYIFFLIRSVFALH